MPRSAPEQRRVGDASGAAVVTPRGTASADPRPSSGPSREVLLVHALERRVRLRSPVLAGQRAACQRVAEELAREPGCEVVKVRPLTGSVIIERGEGKLDPEGLRTRLTELVDRALDDHQGRPIATALEAGAHPGPTRVARAIAHAFVAINADMREAMDGHADLGTILPVFFASAGLTEIGVTGKLPVPAWFNLLWWSVRSFMTFNPEAVLEELRGNGAQPTGAGPAGPGAGTPGDPAPSPGG